MVASLLDQVTVLSVALSGATVAVSFSLWPLVRGKVVLFKVTEVTATMLFFTVTTQVADLPPTLAVMVAVPSTTAVTTPLATVATAALEVAQVTVCSSASLGLIVAVRVVVCPSSRVTEVRSSVTL